MKIRKAPWTRILPWFLVILAVILVDQLSKYFVLHHLYVEESIKVLPFFNLILRFNQGAAFSFLGDAGGWQVFFLSMVSMVVMVVLFIWLLRLTYPSAWTACALSLVIGGAGGNLIDRLHYAFVIDFFDFHIGDWHYATFNVADSAIVIGVGMLLLQALFKKKAH